MGRPTPNGIVWVIEDRSPEAIATCQHYLGARCMTPRYAFPDDGGFWSTNFTSA